MAKATPDSTSEAPSAKKSYIALTNILGEPVGADADGATKTIAPHKLYRKGATIQLNEKDATRLLKLKCVAPIK